MNENSVNVDRRALITGGAAVFLSALFDQKVLAQSLGAIQPKIFEAFKKALKGLNAKDAEDFSILQNDSNAMNAFLHAFTSQIIEMQNDIKYGPDKRKMLGDLDVFMRGFEAKFQALSKLSPDDVMTKRAIKIMRILCLSIAQDA